jgi:DNA-binding transcriptional LysR family regulator
VDAFRRLRFFRDLVDVLSTDTLTLDGAAGEMKRRGWPGGAAYLSRELNALERQVSEQTTPEALVHRVRGGREARVTDLGQELCKRIDALEKEYRQCLRMKPKPPPVVVGLTTTISTLYFPLVLARSGWLAKYPDIELVIREYEWRELMQQLVRGGVDFAVGPVLPHHERFDRKLLYRVKRVLLFPRKYATLSRLRSPDVGWEELGAALKGKTLFTLPQGAQPRQDLGRLFEVAPVLRRVELSSQVEIIAYVQHGLGVGITSARYSQPWEGDARLSSLDVTHLLEHPTDVYRYIPRKKPHEVREPVSALVDAFEVYASNPKELYAKKA